MDGSSSAGNSMAALSHILPADTLQPSDCISVPEDAVGQSQEPLSLPTFQDQQSFPGNLQNLAENHQKPSESLQESMENLRLPQEPDKSHQKPVENIYQGLEMDQKPPESCYNPTGDPEDEPDVPVGQDPLELLCTPPKEPEPGRSLALSGPTSNCQDPSMSEEQKVVAPAPPGPGSHQPPGDSPRIHLHQQGDTPERHSPVDPPELHPPGGDPLELCPPGATGQHHPPEEPPELRPPEGDSTELHPPELHPPEGDSTELHPPELHPPEGDSAEPHTPDLHQHRDASEFCPPGDPPELHLQGGDPLKVRPPGATGKHHPPEDPPELRPPEGDPSDFCPSRDAPELQSPGGDLPRPTGSDHQDQSESASPPSPSSPEWAPSPVAPLSAEAQLCGFLLKLGGPLKTWKRRWFSYDAQRNRLLYYRRPQDLTPLGQVWLSGATFSPLLEAHSSSSSSSFHIHTPQRTFTLKAVDRELMFYWLQQLQLKRWQHRQLTTAGPEDQADHCDFLRVRRPAGLVGQQAANSATQRAPLANLSIKHPLIELQNLVHSLLRSSSSSSSSCSSISQDLSRSVFHVDAPPPWTPPTTAYSASEGTHEEEVQDVQHSSIHPSSGRRRSRTCTSPATPPLLSVGRRRKRSSGKLFPPGRGSDSFSSTSSSSNSSSSSLTLCYSSSTSTPSNLQQDNILTEEFKAQEKLKEEVKRLQEKNRARQEVIMKLSDQLTSYMANQEAASCLALKQLQQEVENLRDDLQAHQNQNRFLNSELFQLTRLWRSSSEQEKNLMVKCAHLEAHSFQVERSYLDVLQPLLGAQNLDREQREALQQLVEQSQQRALQSSARVQDTRDQYDQYGFKLMPDYEMGDLKLLARIQAQEIQQIQALEIQQIQALEIQQIQAQQIQALEVHSQQEAFQGPLLQRWSQYLAGRPDHDLGAGPELKALLRSGIPPQYRARVWRWMVRTRTRTVGELRPQSYQQLCQKIQTASFPASRQIDLDLHRTLTANQHFSSPSSPAHQQLRRILLAFSWRNPAIGYCQGLNRLAAVALLVLQEEEEAFWCLVAVVEAILPQDYYTSNLVASQADQRVLKDFVEEKLPRLAAHLWQHGVDVTLVTFHWFLVVFVENLPGHVLLPLWDAFLYEGSKVVFRYALALLKYKEAELLRLHDASDLYHFLRFFPRTVTDSRRLASIAFRDMNPFPGRLLRSRRALHLERLQGELQELEQRQQKDLVTERAKRRDKELGAVAGGSEDDDL